MLEVLGFIMKIIDIIIMIHAGLSVILTIPWIIVLLGMLLFGYTAPPEPQWGVWDHTFMYTSLLVTSGWLSIIYCGLKADES